MCASNNADVDVEHPLLVSLIPLCIEKVVLDKLTGCILVIKFFFRNSFNAYLTIEIDDSLFCIPREKLSISYSCHS